MPLEREHPFIKAVEAYAYQRVRLQNKRLDVVNAVSQHLGYRRGAVSNIEEKDIPAAAAFITEKDAAAVPFLSEYLP